VDTALQQIVQTVKEAQSRQPDIQNLADRISAYFVPAVIANAVLWGVVWYLLPATLADFVEVIRCGDSSQVAPSPQEGSQSSSSRSSSSRRPC